MPKFSVKIRAFLTGLLVVAALASCGSAALAAQTQFQLRINPAPPSGGGGGGGGGFYYNNTVSFFFIAFPSGTVTLLKDGQVANTVGADSNGRAQMTLTGLTQGTYQFSAYGTDVQGRQSSPVVLTLAVTGGTAASVSDIFLPPIIALGTTELTSGSLLNVTGTTAPHAFVTISTGEKVVTALAVADGSGSYSARLDTSVFPGGSYSVKAMAALGDNLPSSSYGYPISFSIGPAAVPTPKCGKTPTDLNGDGKVNLVDFSILAYWYKRPTPPPCFDLQVNGKIDLVDFSIMAYHWTG